MEKPQFSETIPHIIDRVSVEGGPNALSQVRVYVCFHSNFVTVLTFSYIDICKQMGHDFRSPRIEDQCQGSGLARIARSSVSPGSKVVS